VTTTAEGNREESDPATSGRIELGEQHCTERFERTEGRDMDGGVNGGGRARSGGGV